MYFPYVLSVTFFALTFDSIAGFNYQLDYDSIHNNYQYASNSKTAASDSTAIHTVPVPETPVVVLRGSPSFRAKPTFVHAKPITEGAVPSSSFLEGFDSDGFLAPLRRAAQQAKDFAKQIKDHSLFKFGEASSLLESRDDKGFNALSLVKKLEADIGAQNKQLAEEVINANKEEHETGAGAAVVFAPPSFLQLGSMKDPRIEELTSQKTKDEPKRSSKAPVDEESVAQLLSTLLKDNDQLREGQRHVEKLLAQYSQQLLKLKEDNAELSARAKSSLLQAVESKKISAFPVPVEYSTVLVLLAHDRYDYIQRTLERLLKAHNVEKYTIMVSVDRDSLIEKVKEAVHAVPNPNNIPIFFLASEQPFADVHYQGDASITRHMASVFHQVFKLRLFEYVIFLEDDLEVSYDFFDYFATVGPLLHPFHPTASNLFCVSAWNDNGFNHAELDPSRVFRTDWYPGLGVLFHRSMWVGRMEFEWPVWDSVEWGYDNWLRYRSTITQTHDCLAPEVPRTFHYAKHGMHVHAEAAPMYARMALSDGKTSISESHILTATTALNTRAYYKKLLQESTLVNLDDLLTSSFQDESVVAYFDDKSNPRDPEDARRVLSHFDLYPDNFRMRFRGLLTFKLKSTGTRITLIGESMRDFWSQ